MENADLIYLVQKKGVWDDTIRQLHRQMTMPVMGIDRREILDLDVYVGLFLQELVLLHTQVQRAECCELYAQLVDKLLDDSNLEIVEGDVVLSDLYTSFVAQCHPTEMIHGVWMCDNAHYCTTMFTSVNMWIDTIESAVRPVLQSVRVRGGSQRVEMLETWGRSVLAVTELMRE
jgi:hypothetical protein